VIIPSQMPVVVADPGHGGQTKVAGSSANHAMSSTGLLEKDLALDISQRAAAALSEEARVILTRSGDVNLSLTERATVARTNGASVFCSIHFNATSDPSIDGVAVWVARDASPASLALGQAVLDDVVAATGSPSRGVQRANLGVLASARHQPGTAACLVELGYLSNAALASRLSDTTYRQRLAGGLATAIRRQIAAAGASQPQGLSFGYARAQEIVEPNVDYNATSIDDANRIWQDWLDRYAQWAKGVPDSALTSFPHAAICQLVLHSGSGGTAYGTGFYIADEVLLTCGHNFLDQEADGSTWTTTSVDVQPGHSPVASTLAAKTFSVTAADVVHPRWLASFDNTHDLAVLRVPGLPQTAGTFTPANRSLGANEGIVVCGYGKLGSPTHDNLESQGQRMDGAHISEADTEMVYYPIQTVGGHSGSPVFNRGTVIGVHTGPRRSIGDTSAPHENRGVLLNPEKIDWINSKAGTSFGQSLDYGEALGGWSSRALTDENSPQAEQSDLIKQNVARSLGQAETGLQFDQLSHDSNRVNFGIASWTGEEIAQLLDVYRQVAAEQNRLPDLFNFFGGEAAFQGLRDSFANQGAAFVATAAQEAALRALGRDVGLQAAQLRKLATDVSGMLDDIGNNGNPWYPWIDGGMGAISELAAHVLVHARHQSGRRGFRTHLRRAIDHFGGESALGQSMVAGTVTEADFLARVGEEVALDVLPALQQGVRNRYNRLLRDFGASRLAFYFHPAAPPPPTGQGLSRGLAVTQLGYGVPGGRITDGFYRDAAEKVAITGTSAGRSRHLGIDISLSNASGGGVDDARRGLPVYAAVKRTIPIADLNAVRVANGAVSETGLGLPGGGDATLSHAIVLSQPWNQPGDAYGGVVGLACRYTCPNGDGTSSTITLYLEYLHLITATYLPQLPDGSQVRTATADEWAATGKGIGFGPSIVNGARLSADDLTAGDPILVGYIGATRFPHTHLQAAFKAGEQRYLGPRTPAPRFDPAVIVRLSSTVGS